MIYGRGRRRRQVEPDLPTSAPCGPCRIWATAGRRSPSRSSSRVRRSGAARSTPTRPSIPELFACDAMIIADMGNIEPGVPTFTTALRGTADVFVIAPHAGRTQAQRRVRRSRPGRPDRDDARAGHAARRPRQRGRRRPARRDLAGRRSDRRGRVPEMTGIEPGHAAVRQRHRSPTGCGPGPALHRGGDGRPGRRGRGERGRAVRPGQDQPAGPPAAGRARGAGCAGGVTWRRCDRSGSRSPSSAATSARASRPPRAARRTRRPGPR